MDENEIHRLRNLALYAGYKNPLIEWTISDEWLEPARVLDSRGNRLARGSKHGMTGITFNEIHGEINAR